MSSKANPQSNLDVAKLRDMVKDIEFCMLTTIDEQGNPHSRPMSTNKQIEFDGDLWFFVYGNSHKAIEVSRQPKVNCSFADPSNQSWVSMTGEARIVRDRAKMEQLWQPQLKAWFPKGLDEPDIALLKVDVERAEYWDNPSSTIAHAYSLASTLVTGKAANPGDNREVNLRTGSTREGSSVRQNDRHSDASRGSTGGSSSSGSGSGSGSGSSSGATHTGTRSRDRDSDYRYSYGGGGRARSSSYVDSGDEQASAGLPLLVGAALGAAAYYFLDPERGDGNRAQLVEQLSSFTNRKR